MNILVTFCVCDICFPVLWVKHLGKEWNASKCIFDLHILSSTCFISHIFVSLHYESEVKVLVAQSCLTLCDPMDCSPPGSSVHGILQARILEWLPCPPPGDLPNPGIEPGSPAFQANSLPSEPLYIISLDLPPGSLILSLTASTQLLIPYTGFSFQ